jgi:hypothetical protein
MRYLQSALTFIDTGNELESRTARIASMQALTFLNKLSKIPDVNHIYTAVQATQAEVKMAAENTA